MTHDAIFVLVLLAVAAGLMATNRVRYDLVALMVLVALMLSGVLTIPQTLAGFGSPVFVLVAGMLVLGEMLARTGVAQAVGDWMLARGGTSEARLLVLVMGCAAVLSAVMASSAVVAIFIPVVVRIAQRTRLDERRMLMPMSFAALIGGTLTLIGTNPNIVVHEELKEQGFAGFGFFSLLPVAAAVLLAAIAYMLLVGRRLLGRGAGGEDGGREPSGRGLFDLWDDYRGEAELRSLHVGPASGLEGLTLAASRLEGTPGVRVAGLLRSGPGGERRIAAPSLETELHAGDVLVCVGSPQALRVLEEEHALERRDPTERSRQRWLWESGGARVIVPPDSRLVGLTLRASELEAQAGIRVLGVRRHGKRVTDFEGERLRAADELFVVGPWAGIERLQKRPHDVIVVELPREQAEIVPSYRRLPVALAILLAMVLVTALGIVPLLPAVLLACLAAVLTRCLTMEDAYRAIPWSILLLLAGMLPLADALYHTGGTRVLVDELVGATGQAGPRVTLSVLFFITAGMSLVLSNVAAAVLVAPIAVYAAADLGVSPYPLAAAVLMGASAAYATPISTPVVTLVVNPGRYRFLDFVRVGLPLLLLTWLVVLLLTPLVFPFHPVGLLN